MNNDLYKKMKIVMIEGEFDDVFKIPTKADHWSRIGTKNPDGSYTVGKYTVHPGQQSKYPILSHRYKYNIYVVEKLDGIPKRAYATAGVVAELAEAGVEWLSFVQLKLIPPEQGSVNSGLQAIGKYRDLGIIYETKMGIRKHSAGFLTWVGPFSKRKSAYGTMHSSSIDAMRNIQDWLKTMTSEPKANK